MLCCTSAIPVLLGLSEKLHPLLGGASLVFSCLFSFFCTSRERAEGLLFSLAAGALLPMPPLECSITLEAHREPEGVCQLLL